VQVSINKCLSRLAPGASASLDKASEMFLCIQQIAMSSGRTALRGHREVIVTTTDLVLVPLLRVNERC